jgi:integrase
MNNEMIKKEVIMPKLNDCRGDLSRQWFVYYSVFNPAVGKMQVYRDYKDFANYKTVAEKRKFATKRINYWRRKLLSGYNPFFEADKIKYKNLLRYQTTTRRAGSETETPKNFAFYSSRYLDYVKNTLQLRASTVTCYKSKLRIFGQFLTKKRINNVSIRYYNLDTINEFNQYLIDERKLEGKIMNDYNVYLKRFFKYCIKEEKIINVNPCDDVRKYIEVEKHHIAFNKVYIDKIRRKLEREDPWLWLMIQLLYGTLMRPKELRFLQIKHICWEDGTIHLPASIAKNKKDRVITIPDWLLDCLLDKNYNTFPEEYFVMSTNKKPGEKPASKNFLYNKHKAITKGQNIPDGYDLYSWKHTGVQHLLLASVDIKFIQNQLGHRSLDEMIPYCDELRSQANEEIRKKSPRL